MLGADEPDCHREPKAIPTDPICVDAARPIHVAKRPGRRQHEHLRVEPKALNLLLQRNTERCGELRPCPELLGENVQPASSLDPHSLLLPILLRLRTSEPQ